MVILRFNSFLKSGVKKKSVVAEKCSWFNGFKKMIASYASSIVWSLLVDSMRLPMYLAFPKGLFFRSMATGLF